MKVINPETIVTSSTPTFSRASTATYFDSSGVMQTASNNVLRIGYDPVTLQWQGAIIEPSRTNRFLNSASLSTQTVSGLVSGALYVLSFYGTGTISYSGGSLTGTGAYPVRVYKTLTATGTSMTFTVSGTVQYAQIEFGGIFPTSYIPTTTTVQTRAADVLSGNGVFATNVTDSTPAYNAGTTYADGAVVQYQGKKYESLQSGNIGKDPLTETLWWLDLGATNVYAMFDQQVSSKTANALEIYYCIKTDAVVTGLALFDIVPSLSSTLYPITITGSLRSSTLGYSMSISKTLSSSDQLQAVFTDPSISSDIICFRLKATSAAITVTSAVMGKVTDLGSTQYGATAGIVDYSKKETDEFGTITFVERAYSKRLSAKVVVDNDNLNSVQRLLYSLRAKPAAWLGSDDTRFDEVLTVYGFYRDFSTDIAYPDRSICNLEIEGLT